MKKVQIVGSNGSYEVFRVHSTGRVLCGTVEHGLGFEHKRKSNVPVFATVSSCYGWADSTVLRRVADFMDSLKNNGSASTTANKPRCN